MLLYASLLRKNISFTNKTLSFHFTMVALGWNMRLHMCLQFSIPNFGLVARYPHQPNIGGKSFSRYGNHWKHVRVKLRKFDGFLSFTLSFFFYEHLHCCHIDFLTTPTCTANIIPLEPCALNAEIQHFVLSFSISYWDLIKFPYFRIPPQEGLGPRGWKEAQRQGDFADFSNMLHLFVPQKDCGLTYLYDIARNNHASL